MYSGASARALHNAEKKSRQTVEFSVKKTASTTAIILKKADRSKSKTTEIVLTPKKQPENKTLTGSTPDKKDSAPIAALQNDELRTQMNIAAMHRANEAAFQVYNLVDSSIVHPQNDNNEINNANLEDFFDFLVFGCHGADDATFQQQVADLAGRLASSSKHRPKFVFILGDNFYPHGVQTPDDELFQQRFYQIYHVLAQYGIPCFPILGNHCENLYKLATGKSGVDVGLRQVAHFYLGEPLKTYNTPDGKQISYPTIDSKVKLAKEGHQIPDTVMGKSDQHINLDIKQLPLWSMPGRSNSFIYSNTQFFLIDSNTYVSDYLKYLELKKEMIALEKSLQEEESPTLKENIELKIEETRKALQNNQVACVTEECIKAKAANKRTFLIGHHPPKTLGKRAYEADVTLTGTVTGKPIYFTDEEEKLVRKHFKNLPKDASYNVILDRCLEEQKRNPDAPFSGAIIIAAHDHAMYHYDDTKTNPQSPTCQIVSGGGGGSLQKRLYFGSQENVGGYYGNFGLVNVRCSTSDPKNTEFHYHVLEDVDKENKNKKLEVQFEIRFKQGDSKALRKYKNISEDEQAKIKKLCEAVSKAIDSYLSKFIHEKQQTAIFPGKFFKLNKTHTYDDVKSLHKAWAYMSNYKADCYSVTLETLKKFLPIKVSDHSFSTFLNKEIYDAYKKSTFEQFCDDELLEIANHNLLNSHT